MKILLVLLFVAIALAAPHHRGGGGGGCQKSSSTTATATAATQRTTIIEGSDVSIDVRIRDVESNADNRSQKKVASGGKTTEKPFVFVG